MYEVIPAGLRGSALGSLLTEYIVHEAENLELESRLGELQRMAAQCIRIECIEIALTALDGFGQAIDILLLEQDASWFAGIAERSHRIERPAAAVGDHRRAASLRFDRDDAEIFLAREQQRSATAEMIAHDVVRLPAEKANCRSGDATQTPLILARANDNELAL